MASLFEDPLAWARDVGKSAERDWKNAGRGEVGKYVSGVGQSAYNLALAVPRAAVTGQWSKEIQRGTGAAANLASFGTLDYAARSRGIQKILDADPVIGKNLGGFTRLVNTSSRDGYIRNSDRNLSIQGAVKIAGTAAVAAGAYYGYGYLAGGSKAGTLSSSGAELIGAGSAKAGPGILSAPAYGSSGAAVDLGIKGYTLSSTQAAVAGGASSGFWSTGAGKLLKSAGDFIGDFILDTGKVVATSALLGGRGGGAGPAPADSGGAFPNIYIDGGGGYGMPSQGGGFDYMPSGMGLSEVPKPVLYAGAAIGVLVLLKATKVI